VNARLLEASCAPTAVELPTGTLQIRADPRSAAVLGDYITFGARDNARRGYLFVSKVLGKHYPARPAAMRCAHDQLAAMIRVQPDDRVMVIGMAETATGLGYGVFEALLRSHPGHSVLYGHTTRYWMDEDVLTFEEQHSHAPSLCLHGAADAETAAMQAAANVLVLVDDELSTGATFSNLVQTYRARYPAIERVHVATLTDLSGGRAEQRVRSGAELPVTVGAIIRGDHEFLSSGCANGQPERQAQPRSFRRSDLSIHFGRRPVRGPLEFDAVELAKLMAVLSSDGDRILVLGTGEFMHGAFVLAGYLESSGYSVHAQATTRSPILLGHGIRTKMAVPDHYLENVPNYLYNVWRANYDQVLVCHEGSANAATRELSRLLHARLIGLEFSDGNYALSVC